MAITDNRTKNHEVLKRIKYKSGLEGEVYLAPDPARDWKIDGPTFEHLEPGDYELLLAMRLIKVAGSKS